MNANEIGDLIQAVVNKLPPMELVQIAQQFRNYQVYPILFKGKEGFKLDTRSGSEIIEKVLVEWADSTNFVGLYEPDTVNNVNGLREIKVPFRHSTTSYMFEAHEMEMCSGKHELLDLIKKRREQALGGMCDILERAFFGKPADSTDQKTPWGLFYWLVKSKETTSAAAHDGFFGGVPEGFTDVAGLKHKNWNNYVSPYYSVKSYAHNGTTHDGDFIPKLRKAYTKCNFKSPLGSAEMGKEFSPTYRLFTNYNVIEQVESELEKKNDKLTRDVAPLFGMTCFKGIPFVDVPILEEDQTDPLYGVNLSTFNITFLRGFQMREGAPVTPDNLHNVKVVYIDNSFNWWCDNRRQNFVLSKVSEKAE